MVGLTVTTARAQLFRPGWVVLAQGDTLRGDVEDNSWEEAPTEVRFRPAAGAAVSTYAAADVRAFRLTGRRYFRNETLPLDRTAQVLLDRLPYSPAHHPKSEAFLADVLVTGPATLLRTRVEAVWHYFVQRESLPYLELSERQYLRTNQGRQVIMDGNNYRAELTSYFGDCPALAQAIAKAEFTAPSLIAVVQAYNSNCAATRQPGTNYFATSKSNRPLGFNLGAVLGGRYSSVTLHTQQTAGVESPVLEGVNLDGQVHPIGGACADFLVAGRRLALHTAVLFSTFGRRSATAPNVQGTPGYVDSQGKMTEVRLGARFFWPIGRFGQQIFAGSGFTIPYGWDGEDYYSSLLVYGTNGYRTLPSVGPIPLDTNLPDAAPVTSPLPYVEAGLRQGRFTLTLEGRWLSSDTFADNLSVRNVSTNSSGNNTYEGYQYATRRWYVGSAVAFSLLRLR